MQQMKVRIMALLLAVLLAVSLAVPAAALGGELSDAEENYTEDTVPADEPGQADAPEQTDAPEQADVPEQTDAPKQTDVPEQTDEPEEDAGEPAVDDVTTQTLTRGSLTADVAGRQGQVIVPEITGGTVVPDRTSFDVSAGVSVITLTIRPANGYQYVPDSLRVVELDDGVEGTDITGYLVEVEENSVYRIEVFSNDISVTARFEKTPEQRKYAVMVDEDTENGIISADYAEAEAGWTVTLTAEPDAYRGYATKDVMVQDESGNLCPVTNLGNDRYSFTMPTSDITVSARFGIPVYEITAVTVDDENTGCELDADGNADAGEEVNVWIALRPEAALESLVVTGDETGRIYETHITWQSQSGAQFYYSFTMPDEPVTVTARFAPKGYALSVSDDVEGVVTFSVGGELVTSARYGDTVIVSYTYENTPGTREEIPAGLTYSYSQNGQTAARPMEDFAGADGVYTGSFIMPAMAVEIGAQYISPYTVTLDEENFTAQSVRVEASANGDKLTTGSRVFEGDVVTLFASSDISDGVRAEWHVTWTDEEGEEHEAPITPVGDTAGSGGRFTMPAASVTVRGEFTLLGVQYTERSWNGVQVVESTKYAPAQTLTADTETLSGWYYASENVRIPQRLEVEGTAYLILRDYVTVNCVKGIRVPNGSMLVIYGQPEDSGKLIAKAFYDYQAGIGSNDEDDDEEDGSGAIIIHGGTIEATGGKDAAGIGGGNEAYSGMITIYGGTVTATGGQGESYNGGGAGIGGGDEGDSGLITIYGGTITATGGSYYGAGIGGGCEGDSGMILIYNATVTATGGKDGGAGIGGGSSGTNGHIVIRDSVVIAQPWTGPNGPYGGMGAGIGAGAGRDQSGDIEIYNSIVYAESGYSNSGVFSGGGAGIGGGSKGNGGSIYICDSDITALAYGGAGIGGGYDGGDNGRVEIVSSAVTAISASCGAGIGGGGFKGDGGTIIITDSEVTAAGGGASYRPDLKKPSVTATIGEGLSYFLSALLLAEDYHGAGIGGGHEGDGGNVTITNSTVTAIATTGQKAVAIGRGAEGSGDGSLELSDNLMVRTGKKMSGESRLDISGTAMAADRKNACRTSVAAVISPCDHADAVYTTTAQTHTKQCSHCLTAFTAEAHTVDSRTGTCTVCGYSAGRGEDENPGGNNNAGGNNDSDGNNNSDGNGRTNSGNNSSGGSSRFGSGSNSGGNTRSNGSSNSGGNSRSGGDGGQDNGGASEETSNREAEPTPPAEAGSAEPAADAAEPASAEPASEAASEEPAPAETPAPTATTAPGGGEPGETDEAETGAEPPSETASASGRVGRIAAAAAGTVLVGAGAGFVVVKRKKSR